MLKSRMSHDISCTTCAVQSLCIAHNLDFFEIEEINAHIANIKVLRKKEHLYYIHDTLKNIFAIYSGSCKEYWIDMNGNECVTNFYFAGDLIGLESIAGQQYFYSVAALEQTQVCMIPIENIFKLMETNPNILKRIVNLTSLKMQNDRSTMMGITANERVCDFLINVVTRMHERNETITKIALPMSQIEISNFLGITYETVNRVLQNLKKRKIIDLQNKNLEILDLEQLKKSGRLDYSRRLKASSLLNQNLDAKHEETEALEYGNL